MNLISARLDQHDATPCQIMTNEKRGNENKEEELKKNAGQPI
jgi:hypothetical protein